MPGRSKRAADQAGETPLEADSPAESDALPEAETPSQADGPGMAKRPVAAKKHVEAAGPVAPKKPANGTTDSASELSDAAPNGTLAPSPPEGNGLRDGSGAPNVDPAEVDDFAPYSSLAQQADETALARTDQTLSKVVPDPGLYAVLGLDPSVSDAEIQTTYRRQAARLLGSGTHEHQALRGLNVAYEVLGNPVRRAEYDRLRHAQYLTSGGPTPIRPGAKAVVRLTRRTRPRHVVQPRYAGLPDVFVVLIVVGVAVLAGVLIIPRLSINLSAMNALQNVLPVSNSSRRVIEATVTPAPRTPVPTASARPGLVEHFAGSAVSVSNPNPAQNSTESVVVRLRRDGQPAANIDVWAIVQYRTVEERWPAEGTQKTDGSGMTTITFNVGPATPNYPVAIRVFAQIDDQQSLSWSTSFTPR